MTGKQRREERVECVVTCLCGEPAGTLWKKFDKNGNKVYRHKKCPA